MSLPKEPRQKMINIMYLVLTALLALNVSAEILNAFKTVDHSLESATGIIDKKNADLFKSFKRKLDDPVSREKASFWFPRADIAKQSADSMYNYIEAIKKELKVEAGLKKNDLGEEVYKEDDLDAATRLFIANPPEGKGKGKELFQKLSNFKQRLLSINDTLTRDIGQNLPLDLTIPKTNNKAGQGDWAYHYFHMTPAIAAITILSKLQNDVRNSEAQVVEYCHKEIGEVEIIYDEFQAFASADTRYVMQGEELTITAGIGAFSKNAQPNISIDGRTVPVKDGSGEYKFVANAPGTFSKKVRINFKKPDGTDSYEEKEVKYTVGTPSGLVVSTDRTRVFYVGLDNPLSVTGGSGDEKVNLTFSGSGVSGNKTGPGQYIVTCATPGQASVVATDGKNTQRITIPIKKTPDPLATVGGKAGGAIPVNVFRAQLGVLAELKDFIFEGVKFNVIEYTMIFTGKGFPELEIAEVKGSPYFNDEAKQYIKQCREGSTIIIDEIKVVGPGGTRKLQQNLSFTLQN
jgi:gliding motility-associated protein GldM